MKQPIFENRVALLKEMQSAVVDMLEQSGAVCPKYDDEGCTLSWVSYEQPIELCDGSKVYHITIIYGDKEDPDTEITIGFDECNGMVMDFVNLEPCVAVDLMAWLFGMYYEM